MAPASAPRDPAWHAALARRARALGGAGLLLSYEDAGADAFGRFHQNCAYTYDNAVAGLALLAAGHVGEAAALAEALRQAQQNDRFWRDGRVRNAYRAGAAPKSGPYPLPGYWDDAAKRWMEDGYQAGSATGVVAWTMLLWEAVYRVTRDARLHDAAMRAADWVVRATGVTDGFAGGFIGFEPSPARQAWLSTEQNLDLAVAFAALGRAAEASKARGFVARQWHPKERRFYAGLTPTGTPNPLQALDANVWPSLAPDASPAWAAALDTVLATQSVRDGALQGLDFNTDRDGIWLEGTAFGALAAERLKRPSIAQTFLRTLVAQTAPGGLVYATNVARLTTGLATGLPAAAGSDGMFYYYRRPALAPTGWAALAAAGTSPFDLSLA